MYFPRFFAHMSESVNQGDMKCMGRDSAHIYHNPSIRVIQNLWAHIRNTFVKIGQPGRHIMYGSIFGTYLSESINRAA